MWWLWLIPGALFLAVIVYATRLLLTREDKKPEAKYRVVETYKGEALKYHGEKQGFYYGGDYGCSHVEWNKITDKYDTPEEAQAAIAEWREQGRRDNHHKVVGEIF